MHGASFAAAFHLWEGKRSFQVYFMLGISNKCVYLYLSLVARSSRIYCDVSVRSYSY